jgi:predicted RNA binding protein YcfA (HicA-like mRNA interferase family)
MRNNLFTFGDLERILGDLDFSKIVVKGSHVSYEHPSGALLMLPPHRMNDQVDEKTSIVVRRTLDEFGIMERRQFESLAHKNGSWYLRLRFVGLNRGFAALLDNLHWRGALDERLVVFLTEFGRTPKINKEGGRAHWRRAGSIFFADGVHGGQVIGGTNRSFAALLAEGLAIRSGTNREPRTAQAGP